MRTKVGNALFTAAWLIAAPGSFGLAIPRLLIRSGVVPAGEFRVDALGFLLAAVAVALIATSGSKFVVEGDGTAAAFDPPKRLVVRGPYRFVRNPMYVGVVLLVLAMAWAFRAPWLLLYAVAVWGMFHAFVTFYEERALERAFGPAYRDYKRRVRRWIPGFPPR